MTLANLRSRADLRFYAENRDLVSDCHVFVFCNKKTKALKNGNVSRSEKVMTRAPNICFE